MKILCHRGLSALIDDADAPLLLAHRWYIDRDGYAFTNVGPQWACKRVVMHRLILDAPRGLLVDHINGFRRDNRRANLRLVTARQNSLNRRGKNVVWHKGCQKWQAAIWVNGSTKYLGVFADRADAMAARLAAEAMYYAPILAEIA